MGERPPEKKIIHYSIHAGKNGSRHFGVTMAFEWTAARGGGAKLKRMRRGWADDGAIRKN